MTNQDTYRIPARIIRKIGTRNPFVLAKELGVHVMMRNDFDRQKGAFAMVLNVPFIFINANLSKEMQRIVCAHELGHAMLGTCAVKAQGRPSMNWSSSTSGTLPNTRQMSLPPIC